jgi:Hemerythrin HHE cation binding domain
MAETPERRLAAFGNQLIEVHLWLREELAELRAHIDDGDRPRELRAHCLAFCSAVDRHHTGEDRDAFHRLAAEFPELEPVLAELRRDHRLVEESLQRLEALLADPDPLRVRIELDSLAALMETHFGYEERKIVSALNAMNVPDWARAQPDFLRVDDSSAG